MKNAFEYEEELAALREELAKERRATVSLSDLEVKILDELRQRLTAAEQRNATLVKAATEFMEYAESGWDHFPDVGVNLRAALAQPTESEASE